MVERHNENGRSEEKLDETVADAATETRTITCT